MKSLPRYLELTVIRSWLKGKSRDEIALELSKSQSTISNIISTLRNSMTEYDVDSMRELAKELRRAELTVDNCAVGFRTDNIITKLKIPENEIERFLTTAFEFAKLGVDQYMMREILIESANMSIQVPILKYQRIFINKEKKFNKCTRKRKSWKKKYKV
jgi:DNA-binding CsgD family transcriptional regulator